MPKANPSATEVVTFPAPELTPSETPIEGEQVEETPVEEVVVPPAQEEEKPDPVVLLRDLSAEERTRIRDEVFGDDLRQREKDAESAAYSRIEAANLRQQKNNADLQGTLRNLDAETDDNRRMQHIASFAQGYAQEYATQQAQTWRTYFDDAYKRTFGLTQGEYEATWIDVHKESRKQGREATDADFLAHMMGEKFMPKQQLTKEMREEMAALAEEAVGKRLAGQPAPVTLGPAEAPASDERHEQIMTSGSVEERRAEFKRAHGFDPPF